MKFFIVLPFKGNINSKYQLALNKFIEPFYIYCLENLLFESTIIIVEQSGGKLTDSLPNYYKHLVEDENIEFFNLARTINIGFDILQKQMTDDDVFIFHPIDLLPINANYNVNKTTFFTINNYWLTYKALAIKVSDYKKINGMSNKFWGWGLEDHDFQARLKRYNISNKIVFADYEPLCTHGNMEEDYQSSNQFLNLNEKFFDEFDYEKNTYISGLSDLKYEIISIDEINFLKHLLYENYNLNRSLPNFIIKKYTII